MVGRSHALQLDTEAVRPTHVHRSVVLAVHGVGEQTKGSELKLMTAAFLPLIRKRLDPEAIVTTRPLDDPGPAGATISFKDAEPASSEQREPRSYEIRFIEVWWQAAFNAPGLGEFILGLAQIMTRWGKTQTWGAKDRGGHSAVLGLSATVCFLLLRVLLNVLVLVLVLPLAVVATPLLWLLSLLAGRVSSRRPDWLVSPLMRVLDLATKAQPLIVELVVLAFLPLIVLFLLLLWLIEAVVPKDSLGKLKSFHVWIVKFLTRNWGDMWLYLERPWEASRIRSRFEDQFRAVVDNLDDDTEAVMVLAHSMGSAIAYEALTGRTLRDLLDQTFSPDAGQTRSGGKPQLHFVSVGSALNIAWTIASGDESFRFREPLPAYVDWLNLWTYLDPYARQQLCPPAGALLARPSVAMREMDILQPVREREIVNQQDMFSDHSAYWNNVAQVVAPILNLLTMRNLDNDLQLDVRSRVERVRVLAFVKALAWSVAPAAFLTAYYLLSTGDWPGEGVAEALKSAVDAFVEELPGFFKNVVSVIVDALPQFAINIAPDWMLDGVDASEIHRYLLTPFAVALAAAVVATVVYSTIVKWVWDLWDEAYRFDLRSDESHPFQKGAPR
jgi:hypothetical protein